MKLFTRHSASHRLFLVSIITALPITLSHKLWLRDMAGRAASRVGRHRTLSPSRKSTIRQYSRIRSVGRTLTSAECRLPELSTRLGLLLDVWRCFITLHLFSFTHGFQTCGRAPCFTGARKHVWLLDLGRHPAKDRLGGNRSVALASAALLVDSRFLRFLPFGVGLSSAHFRSAFTHSRSDFVLLVLWYGVYRERAAENDGSLVLASRAARAYRADEFLQRNYRRTLFITANLYRRFANPFAPRFNPESTDWRERRALITHLIVHC